MVGSGSIVTKDIGPYEIWVGNPARFIRKRFDDEVIKNLLECQWWNWNDEKLREMGKCFSDVEGFKNSIR